MCWHSKINHRFLCVYWRLIGKLEIEKQTTVSRSVTEEEYRAITTTAPELVYLIALLKDFRISISLPVLLHCDNRSTIHISKDPVFHERTKYLEIDLHFVREKIVDGVISVIHVRTSHQIADLFTKDYIHSSLIFFSARWDCKIYILPILRGSVSNITHITRRSGIQTSCR